MVAVANQKGGVAKTTTVHALGVAMAEQGKRVLLVDLDPQASLSWACGIDTDTLEISIHDVLLKRAKVSDALIDLDSPEPATDGAEAGVLHLLPATIDLAGAELNLLTKTGREYVLRKALSKVLDGYDRVLIDCPPSLGILTINGLTAADEVLIPLQCESLSQRGVGQLLETIEDVRDYTNKDLSVRGAVATLFDSRTNLAHQVVDDVRSHYDIKVLEPFVPKSVKVAEAPARGLSAHPRAPVAQRPGLPRAGRPTPHAEATLTMARNPAGDRFPVDRGVRDASRAGRRRSLDPQGRRALFETPVSAARDTVRSGPPAEGRHALFSTGPRRTGTVTVTCSGCQARSRINLTDLGLRLLSGSAWMPGRRHSHWMRCPSCDRRRWCRIGWQS